jgi:hypothetical protein
MTAIAAAGLDCGTMGASTKGERTDEMSGLSAADGVVSRRGATQTLLKQQYQS